MGRFPGVSAPVTTAMPSPAPERPVGTGAKVRDPWFDNAKMALVTLVVVGHAWTLLPGGTFHGHVYNFLYAWHVPAFVLVTGYLSRSFAWTRARFWQLFCTVAVPYLIFESAMSLFRIYVGGEKLDDVFADPHWPMWYLSALFLWRLLTPVFRPLWGGLAVALVISVTAGLWAGGTLDLARVLGLLPFFVMGLKATPERLEVLRRRPVQVAAAGVLVGIFVLTTWTERLGGTEWLYYRNTYAEIGDGLAQSMLTRAGVLAVGTLGALAFLAVVPRVNGWFARMGAWTLVVYLFHGFFVKGASYAGFAGWAQGHEVVATVLVSVLAVLLSLFLAWRPVATRLTHLVDPLGYAQKHVQEAVALTVVKAEAEEHAEVLTDAIAEAGALQQSR